MNRNRWTPLAAVAAVVVTVSAVVAGVSLLTRGGTSGPPVLRLAVAAQDSYAAYGPLASAGKGGRGAYRLVGTLPTGPAEARIRNLPAAAAPLDRVRALAVALGESAAPKRVGRTWKAGDLVVTDQPGNPWTFGLACGPDTPVSSDGGSVGDLVAPPCAGGTVSSGTATVSPGNLGVGSSGGSTGAPGSTEPGTIEPETGTSGGSVGSPGSPGSPGSVGACPSPAPGSKSIACGEPAPPSGPRPPDKVLLTEAQAMAATATIRSALGLAAAPTRVEGLSVVVDPLAGRLPTQGIPTVLQLSGKAKLVSATGSLSIGDEGDSYPLRTARKAFDELPVFAMGAPCDAAGCPEGPAITGARLGLSRVALDKGAAALVPAWLFNVQGSPVPLVALAVSEEFLGRPDPVDPNPGIEPGPPPATKPGTEPGPDDSVPPVPPSTAKPADPSGREPFGLDGAYADSDPNVLVVRYGDSGSCPSLAVRHTVVQDRDRIVVTLSRTPMPADRACTMDYQAKLVRITLAAPLAGREVIDGFRKAPVPISTGTPPLG